MGHLRHANGLQNLETNGVGSSDQFSGDDANERQFAGPLVRAGRTRRWLASCWSVGGSGRCETDLPGGPERPGPRSASAAPQATTILVPQNQVTYETVYDVETVQVPVTTTQTQYRTECRTQTVPVTRTVTEQVPGHDNQTQYRTEYRTQTVPVTRTVTEQVPVTVNQTQYRTEYRTQTVPVTRTVTEQVPVTVNQTQYRTEYRTQTVPVTRTVAEVVNVPRTVTVYVPRQQTVNQQVTKTVYNPVTTTQKQQRYVTVQKPVTRTVLQPRTVTDMVAQTQTQLVPQTYTEAVPVTTSRQVVEEQGGYELRRSRHHDVFAVATCAPGTVGGGCCHGGLFSRCGGRLQAQVRTPMRRRLRQCGGAAWLRGWRIHHADHLRLPAGLRLHGPSFARFPRPPT